MAYGYTLRTAGASALRFFKGTTALVALSTLPLSAVTAQETMPVLGKTPVVPTFTQHYKAGPLPVMPVIELGSSSSTKSYRKDNVNSWDGDLSPVFKSTNMVKVGGGYSGAGSLRDGFLDITHRDAKYLVKAVGSHENMGAWDAPTGDYQRYGYTRNTEQVVFGLFPSAGKSLKLIAVRDRIDDNLTNTGGGVTEHGVNLIRGDGQDPIKTERMIGKLVYEAKQPFSGLEAFAIEGGVVDLDREADNFTHRSSTPVANRNKAEMAMRKWAGKASVDFHALGAYNRLSLSGDYTRHDAKRLGGPQLNDLTVVSAYQLPDVRYLTARIDEEAAFDFTPDSHLKMGLRYEFVDASAKRLNASTTNGTGGTLVTQTSQDLYEQYYGTNLDTSSQDHNLSARLDFEQEFYNDTMAVTGAVGRTARSGNTMEKFFAAQSLAGGGAGGAAGTSARTVGNPLIKPEQHNRAELGMRWQGEGWADYGRSKPRGESWRLSVLSMYDRVSDFITRDRAHGQAGILLSNNSVIWRNVDADLASVEGDLQWNMTKHLSTRANVAFNWGRNRSDDRALYGIAPLEVNWLVDYHDDLGSIGTWNAGGKMRLVTRQNRVDDDPSTGSGYDTGKTGGFGVLDLHLGSQLYNRTAVQLGVDNVFNKTYAIHDISAMTDSANPERVIAPGRTFYVRAVANF